MKIPKPIESLIVTVRGRKVLMDADLAIIYGVETKVLNQAVKRNQERFPGDFIFRLTGAEAEELRRSRSQFVTLKRGQNVKYQPYAFTEHGALMTAMVLSSPQAVAMSVYVVRAFTQMREQLAANVEILKRLAEIDKTLLEHDAGLRDVYHRLLPLLAPPPEKPRRRIGFHRDAEG
jgi:phage regulator Rha-like protein